MSYALEPLQVVQSVESVVGINEKREYNIVKGGSENTISEVPSNNWSDSQFIFQVPPPSASTIVDRRIWLRVPVRITLNGTATGAQNLFQSGTGAFRRLPLSSVINTLTITVNGQSRSVNLSDYVDALMRYGAYKDILEEDMSGAPSYPDQTQNYSDLNNFVRNPLGVYGDCLEGAVMPRGGFPFTIISNSPTQTVIEATITEPLMISPLIWGLSPHVNSMGLIGCNNMIVTINFRSDLSRMWSQMRNTAFAGVPQITSVVGSFSAASQGIPTLLFRYVSPSLTQSVPAAKEYGLLDIQSFTSNVGSLNAGVTRANIQSQNIQLQTIPRRMYIFLRKSNSTQTYNDPDAYAQISEINITWNNRKGNLSGASLQSLYNISKKNGYVGSFAQWSAQPTQFCTGANVQTICGSGSVLCVEFGTDIALAPDECPGVSSGGTYNLQFTLTATNFSAVNWTDVSLYLVAVQEGTFSVVNSQTAIAQIGVVSRQDVLNSADAPHVDYNDLHAMAGSGAFLTDLRSTLSKILRGAHRGATKVLPHVKRGVEFAEKALPAFEKGLDMAGLGVVGGASQVGGMVVGGKMLTAAQMRRRLGK